MQLNFQHRCKVPECDISTSPSYSNSWLNFSVPFDKSSNLPEKCKKFSAIDDAVKQSCSIDSFNKSVITQCDDFVYEDEEITILNEVLKAL